MNIYNNLFRILCMLFYSFIYLFILKLISYFHVYDIILYKPRMRMSGW
jgi:hypothetical protein